MRRLAQWTLCATLWGCPDNKVPADTSDSGQSIDTGGDDSADPTGDEPDPDTGSDEDGAADGGGGGDTEGGGDGAPRGCTSADLVFSAEIRDESGTRIDTGFPTDNTELWGRVDNPCSEPVSFTTDSACLVEEWKVTRDGTIDQGTFPCFGGETTRSVANNSHIEQEVMPLNDLTVGTYEFTITFGHRPVSRRANQRAEADASYAVVSR